MPKELTLLEEFDIIAELQFPDSVYSTESLEEKLVFCNFINNLSERRIMLLDEDLFNLPFVFAGLQESHIEYLTREAGHILKRMFYVNISDNDFLNEVIKIANEMDNKEKTTKNSERIKNIIRFLKDNKSII